MDWDSQTCRCTVGSLRQRSWWAGHKIIELLTGRFKIRHRVWIGPGPAPVEKVEEVLDAEYSAFMFLINVGEVRKQSSSISHSLHFIRQRTGSRPGELAPEWHRQLIFWSRTKNCVRQGLNREMNQYDWQKPWGSDLGSSVGLFYTVWQDWNVTAVFVYLGFICLLVCIFLFLGLWD